jgi:hypothetical protein
MPPHHYSDSNPQPWKLQRCALLTGIVILGAGALIGGNRVMAAVEQNTLKRRGVGLRRVLNRSESGCLVAENLYGVRVLTSLRG